DDNRDDDRPGRGRTVGEPEDGVEQYADGDHLAGEHQRSTELDHGGDDDQFPIGLPGQTHAATDAPTGAGPRAPLRPGQRQPAGAEASVRRGMASRSTRMAITRPASTSDPLSWITVVMTTSFRSACQVRPTLPRMSRRNRVHDRRCDRV